jgi:hypothetical protein
VVVRKGSWVRPPAGRAGRRVTAGGPPSVSSRAPASVHRLWLGGLGREGAPTGVRRQDPPGLDATNRIRGNGSEVNGCPRPCGLCASRKALDVEGEADTAAGPTVSSGAAKAAATPPAPARHSGRLHRRLARAPAQSAPASELLPHDA